MMRPQKGVVVIVGVGPKLGKSIGRKFARQGYSVAILARDIDSLRKYADEIATDAKSQVYAIQIDCSQTRSIRDAFESVSSLGFVEVLVYNADFCISWSPTSFNDIKLEDFEKAMVISSTAPFLCAQQVLPGMVTKGKGTILFTGCSTSLNTMAGFAHSCSGKFAMRGLSHCLSREYHPLGVHVAHVVIDGVIGGGGEAARIESSARRDTTQSSDGSSQLISTASSMGESNVEGGDVHSMDPDALAETYWYLHTQDRRAWTQEIVLRPPA